MKDFWLKYKTTVIVVLVAIAALTAAYLAGGSEAKGAADAAAVSVSASAQPSGAPLSPEASAPAVTSEAPSAEPSAKAQAAPGTDSAVSGRASSNASAPAAESAQSQSAAASSAAPSPADTQMTCTLSVSCSALLNNMALLDKAKWNLVPKEGVIYAAKDVRFSAGESVFNVLQREMKKAGIQMEFKNTPLYSSAYIEGIDNLYEFDAGNLSGWVYAVNGVFPNYGCSRYPLKDGDTIRWLYTCDLGKDVGGNNSAGS